MTVDSGKRQKIAIFGLLFALVMSLPATVGHAAEKLRFAVGPFQPTPGDTRKAYDPFFKYLAEQLGSDYELVVTNDWAGISTALANGQADIAWMGPWGYVLANNEGGAQAVATVKYDGQPTYHAIIVARPQLEIKTFPEDAKGLSISFADVGSTSGWLIPSYWFKSQHIDPRTYFKYRDGASHPANEMAVSSGQVDLATDYDRNLNSMIERGLIKREDVKIVWTSEPLPNDPMVVRKDLDQSIVAKLKTVLGSISERQAKTIMPPHYTGWVPATAATYQLIRDAGVAVGKLKVTN
ncbi:phosphate/phosphite/phosphonate ABC transporter substrate-binding protein [Bradyrhizobium sp. BTAi1]|uniref:phosphate/phosphite/phosphonate ABC transporter substrate-binding protein n=1 Tax=Bradyrhizobium sp. (strain BTAi1 / ATCC BAA-1182) TaxID=288000 RepID=UPI00005DEBE5|nr:phosphate/phosphite/phosphonate ABC transporter substrate-binding protein [Bradyrhizobium sp. BTAi1]ABQ35478.1 putative phosphonate transport system binding protein htxB precursor phnD [Bradyrhizobium sp. BTAi1]